jgi:hypothetical protein
MGTPTATGGYVMKLVTGKSITREMTIDDDVFQGVVKALGIDKRVPDAGVNKSASDIQSVFVYRGGDPSSR